MDDLISRQAAIDALYHVDEYNGRSIEAIRNLPSAERLGQWKKNPEYRGDDVSGFIDNHFSCSVCGKEAVINPYGFYDLTPFCPNCGAKME